MWAVQRLDAASGGFSLLRGQTRRRLPKVHCGRCGKNRHCWRLELQPHCLSVRNEHFRVVTPI